MAIIVNQFRFRDFTVLKIMMTAIIVGGLGAWVLHGMVLYGYCPDTGVAAIAGGVFWLLERNTKSKGVSFP